MRKLIQALALFGLTVSCPQKQADNSLMYVFGINEKLKEESKKVLDYTNASYQIYNPQTIGEIINACKEQEGREEAGGNVYTINDSGQTRLRFYLVDNRINTKSEAADYNERGETPDPQELREELIENHVRGKCSRYNTDPYSRREIDEIQKIIDTAITTGSDEDKITAARRIYELNKKSYTITSPAEPYGIQFAGSFHTHHTLSGFSPVDRCLFENGTEKHFVIACDMEKKVFILYSLSGRLEYMLLRGEIK